MLSSMPQPLRTMLHRMLPREVLFYRAPRTESAPPTATRAHREVVSLAPYAAAAQHARFSKGWTLFSLLHEGEPVSYAWARTAVRQWVGELSCAVDAPRQALWIIDCITLPQHRGQGHYPRLLRSLRGSLDGGEALIYCEANNAYSAAGIRKAGFQPIGRVRSRWGRVAPSPDFPLGIVS